MVNKKYATPEEARAAHNATGLAWYHANREQALAATKQYRDNLRLEVIQGYGGECKCCKETNPVFLAVDHVNGGGRKHRETIGPGGGTSFLNWIKGNGFPDTLQLLCHNCNWAKHVLGACPHQEEQ